MAPQNYQFPQNCTHISELYKGGRMGTYDSCMRGPALQLTTAAMPGPHGSDLTVGRVVSPPTSQRELVRGGGDIFICTKIGSSSEYSAEPGFGENLLETSQAYEVNSKCGGGFSFKVNHHGHHHRLVYLCELGLTINKNSVSAQIRYLHTCRCARTQFRIWTWRQHALITGCSRRLCDCTIIPSEVLVSQTLQ